MNEAQTEALYQEFLDFKTMRADEIPPHAFDEAFLFESDDRHREYHLDIVWYYTRQLKNPAASNIRFKLLFEVAKLVLIVPHSTASIEHVFLIVNKNKSETSDRNRMDIEKTLSSILALKLETPESVSTCYNFKPSKMLLGSAKKAALTYNRQHSQSK